MDSAHTQADSQQSFLFFKCDNVYARITRTIFKGKKKVGGPTYPKVKTYKGTVNKIRGTGKKKYTDIEMDGPTTDPHIYDKFSFYVGDKAIQ